MDHTSPKRFKEMIERQFFPNSCQYFISRKQSNFITFPPAKICSTIMHSRFGLGGCSKFHCVLTQATTPGVEQGITSRWVAEQCPPWHQSHILVQLFPIPAHVFSTISWMFLGMTPGRRASLGNLGAHQQNFFIRDHMSGLSTSKETELCEGTASVCPTSDIHFTFYLLGKIEWLKDFLAELWLQAQGRPGASEHQSSPLELSEEKWVRPCSLSHLGLWL